MTIYSSHVRLKDAYVISQDISAIQATVPVVDVAQHPADYVTMTGVFEALEKGPQSHAQRRTRVPAWAVTLVGVGTVLAVLGLALNDPVVRMLWLVLS